MDRVNLDVRCDEKQMRATFLTWASGYAIHWDRDSKITLLSLWWPWLLVPGPHLRNKGELWPYSGSSHAGAPFSNHCGSPLCLKKSPILTDKLLNLSTRTPKSLRSRIAFQVQGHCESFPLISGLAQGQVSACSLCAPEKSYFWFLEWNFSPNNCCLAPEDSSQHCARYCSWHYRESCCDLAHWPLPSPCSCSYSCQLLWLQ